MSRMRLSISCAALLVCGLAGPATAQTGGTHRSPYDYAPPSNGSAAEQDIQRKRQPAHTKQALRSAKPEQTETPAPRRAASKMDAPRQANPANPIAAKPSAKPADPKRTIAFVSDEMKPIHPSRMPPPPSAGQPQPAPAPSEPAIHEWSVPSLMGTLIADGQKQPRSGSQVSTPAMHQESHSMSGMQPGTMREYFPSGDNQSSAIMLERMTPPEVRLGESLSYEVKVTNLTSRNLMEVELVERLAAGFELKSTSPKASNGGDSLRWSWNTLGSRETKTVTISGVARATGQLRHCGTVTFKTDFCSETKVVEPILQLTKSAPEQVIQCDEIPLHFVVRNAGSGVARNVRISDNLPAGWTTSEGQQTSLVLPAGDLTAGQAREFTVNVRSSETGSFTNKATATEDGGLSAEAEAKTEVSKPELTIEKKGPALRYVGRPATYEITVSNNGNAPANDTILTDEIPVGTKLVQGEGGSVTGNKLIWKLGNMAPNSSKSVNITLLPTAKGIVKNMVEAKAYCAEASAFATTEVKGVPAILLECVDVEDPIEVGAMTTYLVTVTNQGSSEGTNVAITCTLPAELEYVSCNGPSAGSNSGQVINFAPLPKLPERTRATFKIVAKGVGTGDVRFRMSMTTDQQKVPVEETESTHIYE